MPQSAIDGIYHDYVPRKGCLATVPTNTSPSQTIDRLPTELLQMIFRIVTSTSNLELDSVSCHSRNGFTILASQVSCRWRHITLGDPFLWSIIPVATSHPSSVEYFQAFIERSQGHRLTINIRHSESDQNRRRLCSILDIMRPHGARLGELSMTSCESITELFHEKLAFPAPTMDTLRLFNSPQAPPALWSPGAILGGRFPRLRHLELSGWSDWRPPHDLFLNVTHLTLSSERMLYVPSSSLFDLLGQCSRLKHLELKFISPRFNPPDNPTSLNHLQTLLLERCDTPSILSHLILPPNLDVTVWEEPESSSVMQMPADCSRLRSLDDIVKVRLDVVLEEMKLTAHNRNGSCFEWSQVAYSDSLDGDYDDIIVSSVRHLLRVAMPRFRSFNGIQEFTLYCEKFEPDSFTPGVSWGFVLEEWTVLTTLTLWNFPVEEVMLALTPPKQNSSAVLCPQLEVIQLHVCEANMAMFDILTGLFTTREAQGSTIRNLKMWLLRRDCRIYKEELMGLKDCVRNMQVVRR